MKKTTRILLNGLAAVAVVAALASCSSSVDKVDSGGVTLSVTDFDGLPITVSVNTAADLGFVQVGQIDVENVPLNPTGVTSDLMDVEIRSYEVTYSRADTGTRVPPKYTRGLFGIAPVSGTFTVENLPVMGLDQLLNEPLSDLLFENGGVDSETGSQRIQINFKIRFFGRTLGGKAVETGPAYFTVEFTP